MFHHAKLHDIAFVANEKVAYLTGVFFKDHFEPVFEVKE
jgi:hypothetical protein